MPEKIDSRIPRYNKLIMPAFTALKELGCSGTNEEILNQIIEDLHIPDEVADILHTGSVSQTELSYQLAWAKTYLSKYGAIQNSARSVWSISPDYVNTEALDEKEIVDSVRKRTTSIIEKVEPPEELEPWKEELAKVIQTMNPYGFERLTQKVLRECGFSQVKVTKKSGDGGIDGVGQLKINDIVSFNVAFQCKRYSGVVGSPCIRDFRGALSAGIEKGLFITTGTFSTSAYEEACSPGKKQIDLIDGKELVDILINHRIGVREAYIVDREFFEKI